MNSATETTPQSRKGMDLLHDQITVLLEHLRQETRVPGIGVTIDCAGQRVDVASGVRVLGGTEPLLTRCRFHVGCVAKLLGSLVALELSGRGVLNLNAPIEQYLPELRGTLFGRSVALVHLLSHTSGYRGLDPMDAESRALTWDEFVKYLATAQRLFEPGTVFGYEHTGAVLVGEIVRRTTKAEILQLAREMILEPLGIEPGQLGADQGANPTEVGTHEFTREGRFVNTTWHAREGSGQLPAAGFWRAAFSNYTMSLADLAALGNALAGVNGAGAIDSGLSMATRSQLQRRVIDLPRCLGGFGTESQPRAFTLGAAEFPGGWFGIDAQSLGQCLGLRFHPVKQVSIAVGINAFAPHVRDLVLACMCGFMASSEARATPVIDRFGFELSELQGTYLGNGRRECDVRLKDGCLTCTFGVSGSNRTSATQIVVDDDHRPVMRSTGLRMPIGFFRVRGEPGGVGLLSGLSAYRRVSAAPLTSGDETAI